MSPEQIATALLGLGIGLGTQRALDPEVDVDVFAEAMRQVLGVAGC